jgi:hypothetical protein
MCPVWQISEQNNSYVTVHFRSFWYWKEHPFWNLEFLLWSQVFECSIKACEINFIGFSYLASWRALKLIAATKWILVSTIHFIGYWGYLKNAKSSINFDIYVSLTDCVSLCAFYTWAPTEIQFMKFLSLFFNICHENSSFIKIWQECTQFTRRPVFIYDTLISSHVSSWKENLFRLIWKEDLYRYFVLIIVYWKFWLCWDKL